MGIRLSELFASLQTYLGSSYVNDFNRYERVFRVVMQADGSHRRKAEQIMNLPFSTAGESSSSVDCFDPLRPSGRILSAVLT